jgi:tetratricopeptide (TPR) repeat protein
MLGLAEVRFAQEKWQQAGAMATRAALHLSKSSYFLARAHLVAARAFINADRPDAALQQLRKAVEADPDNEEARLLKISLEAHLGVQPQ